MGCYNQVLTAQEEIAVNEKNPLDKLSGRILKISERLRNTEVYMDIHRGRLVTESFKETEGQDIRIRWAKALKNVADHIPVVIGEDELIIGKMAGRDGKTTILFPELEGTVLPDLKLAHQRKVSPFNVTSEDYEIIMEEIYPYWKDKTYAQAFANALPVETRHVIFGDNAQNYTKNQYVINPTTASRTSMNYSHDYATILARGMKSLQEEAQDNLEKCKKDPMQYAENSAYLEASIIACEAFIIYAKRYAKYAAHLAEQEASKIRKEELERIAIDAEWVSENPATTFRQALQLQWFVMIFCRLEQHCGTSLSCGRLDQILYPYYKQDMEAGILTNEEVIELFRCIWLNFAQCINTKLGESSSKMYEAYAHFETVTIGGRTRTGKDATNELSYLILDSKRNFFSTYPDLAARIHSRTPDKFLRTCIEVLKDGQGFPKFFNDEEIVPNLIAKGVKLQDALDYNISGCTEARTKDETYVNGIPWINLGSIVEMALNNGRLKILGDKKIGLETGNPRNFTTFEEFYDACRKQHEFCMHHALVSQMVADQIKPSMLASPFCSVLVGACRKTCRDIHQNIDNTFREIFMDQIGVATFIDSLAAIKKLVFDDKEISMAELILALDNNFVGYEILQEKLKNAPKFGNNDAYADAIGVLYDKDVAEYLSKQQGLYGEIISRRCVPITTHIPAGAVIGATPDGRKAGQYLSEGTSPNHGAEKNGPTALLMSNSVIKHEGFPNHAAWLLNVKMNPAAVAGDEGVRKMMALIRAWCDLKLWHIQFNIINRETLIAAKKEPEKYKDLIVRVAGYSAYFSDLSPKLKDELIERTEHVF